MEVWKSLNCAWLGLLQRQKDGLESKQEILHPQTLMTKESLIKMGKQLIRLCDLIECKGLVDYEYGMWEEYIITSESFRKKHQATNAKTHLVLKECLDLCEPAEEVI